MAEQMFGQSAEAPANYLSLGEGLRRARDGQVMGLSQARRMKIITNDNQLKLVISEFIANLD